MSALKLAEYIWLDGSQPVQRLRSKARVVTAPENGEASLDTFPKWSFDGSSTNQADGTKSDLVLIPVRHVADPTRGEWQVDCSHISGLLIGRCDMPSIPRIPRQTSTSFLPR